MFYAAKITAINLNLKHNCCVFIKINFGCVNRFQCVDGGRGLPGQSALNHTSTANTPVQKQKKKSLHFSFCGLKTCSHSCFSDVRAVVSILTVTKNVCLGNCNCFRLLSQKSSLKTFKCHVTSTSNTSEVHL